MRPQSTKGAIAHLPSIWAIIVAAGSGERFGSLKQFATLGGRPVLTWSIDAVRTIAQGVVLVVPKDEVQNGETDESFPVESSPQIRNGPYKGADVVTSGGPSRSASVRKGLEAIPATPEFIVVHDAVRPLAAPALFQSLAKAMCEASPAVGGVICAIPVTDTLKSIDAKESRVTSTLDRTSLIAVQTPQIFRSKVLRFVHDMGEDATDDAALVESSGATVLVVPGDPSNVKITTKVDLSFAQFLIGP